MLDVCLRHRHRHTIIFGSKILQVAGEMAAAGLQRMMAGYEREKECSDLQEPKGFICVSSTGFAGGAPSPDLSGIECDHVASHPDVGVEHYFQTNYTDTKSEKFMHCFQ